MPDISSVDLFIFVALALSSAVGFLRGFTREALGAVSWVGAGFITLHLLPYLRPLTLRYIDSNIFASLATSSAVFTLSLAALGFVTKVFSSKIKGSVLSGLDRSLGAVFGVARAWFLFALAYLTAAFWVSPAYFPAPVKTARAMPFIERGVDVLRKVLPETEGKSALLAVKPGKASPDEPAIAKVVAALSQPLPKIAEPAKKGPATNCLTDIIGL